MAAMNRIQKYIVLFFFLLSGCVTDPIYNTNHPDQAQITVMTTWTDRGEGIEKPSAYLIHTGNKTEQATTDIYTLKTLFGPGTYTLNLYNEEPLIPVSEGVVTVQKVTAPTGNEETYIESLPGWLFTGSVTMEAEKDQDYQWPVTMHQQVRELTLLIEAEGSGASLITGIAASLTGVAGTLVISDQVHSNASHVFMNFQPVTEGSHTGKWSATVRLLGITGEHQIVTGTVTLLTGTHPESVPLETNLSDELAGFNTNKKRPLALTGKISIEPDPEKEAGFTATINGWKPVSGGSGIAK